MRISKSICSVCKEKIKGDEYKLSSSYICGDCNKKDYINSGEVAKLLDLHQTCVAKHVRNKRYDIIPKADAHRCRFNLVWMRTTIVEFKKTVPIIDRTAVSILKELGLTKQEIADELNVNVFYVNRLNIINIGNSNAKKKAATHKDNVDGVIGLQQYHLANKLLNKCLNNTLTL